MKVKENWKWQLVFVLYGLVALLWIGRCVTEFRSYGQIGFVPFLCAVAWIVLFFIQLRRYRREKDRED